MAKKRIRISVLDTNVLVRFLVGDVPKQQAQATVWFEEAEMQNIEIVVLPLVVAESCFVFESFYKLERSQIAEALKVFLSQRWLQVTDRDILLGLWTHYLRGLHFVDSFILAWAEVRGTLVLSFDRKIARRSTQ